MTENWVPSGNSGPRFVSWIKSPQGRSLQTKGRNSHSNTVPWNLSSDIIQFSQLLYTRGQNSHPKRPPSFHLSPALPLPPIPSVWGKWEYFIPKGQNLDPNGVTPLMVLWERCLLSQLVLLCVPLAIYVLVCCSHSQHCCVFLSMVVCFHQTELLCIPLTVKCCCAFLWWRVLLGCTEEVAQQPQQLEMVTEEERRKQEEKSRKIKNIIGKSHCRVVAFVCALGVGQRTIYEKYTLITVFWVSAM